MYIHTYVGERKKQQLPAAPHRAPVPCMTLPCHRPRHNRITLLPRHGGEKAVLLQIVDWLCALT